MSIHATHSAPVRRHPSRARPLLADAPVGMQVARVSGAGGPESQRQVVEVVVQQPRLRTRQTPARNPLRSDRGEMHIRVRASRPSAWCTALPKPGACRQCASLPLALVRAVGMCGVAFGVTGHRCSAPLRLYPACQAWPSAPSDQGPDVSQPPSCPEARAPGAEKTRGPTQWAGRRAGSRPACWQRWSPACLLTYVCTPPLGIVSAWQPGRIGKPGPSSQALGAYE